MPIIEFVVEMRNRLKSTYTIVKNLLHMVPDQMKTHYDIRVNSPGFSVCLDVQPRSQGKTLLKAEDWDGPYAMIKQQ